MVWKESQRRSEYKHQWTKKGMKVSDEEFEFVWGAYKSITNCMVCDNPFEFTHFKLLKFKDGKPSWVCCKHCIKIDLN
jgi:hypothetical protein